MSRILFASILASFAIAGVTVPTASAATAHVHQATDLEKDLKLDDKGVNTIPDQRLSEEDFAALGMVSFPEQAELNNSKVGAWNTRVDASGYTVLEWCWSVGCDALEVAVYENGNRIGAYPGVDASDAAEGIRTILRFGR
jgi:hypothetical protein